MGGRGVPEGAEGSQDSLGKGAAQQGPRGSCDPPTELGQSLGDALSCALLCRALFWAPPFCLVGPRPCTLLLSLTSATWPLASQSSQGGDASLQGQFRPLRGPGGLSWPSCLTASAETQSSSQCLLQTALEGGPSLGTGGGGHMQTRTHTHPSLSRSGCISLHQGEQTRSL